MERKKHTCCFFGHRKIEVTDALRARLFETIEDLICNKKVDTFLFGSNSNFDELCLQVVTALKIKYPHIRRVYVRAEFPYINESYTAFVLKSYDETYYPEKVLRAGRAAYVKRNYEMIDNSRYCVTYYDKTYMPENRKRSKRDMVSYQPKSGTELAYTYAVRRGLQVLNLLRQK